MYTVFLESLHSLICLVLSSGSLWMVTVSVKGFLKIKLSDRLSKSMYIYPHHFQDLCLLSVTGCINCLHSEIANLSLFHLTQLQLQCVSAVSNEICVNRTAAVWKVLLPFFSLCLVMLLSPSCAVQETSTAQNTQSTSVAAGVGWSRVLCHPAVQWAGLNIWVILGAPYC